MKDDYQGPEKRQHLRRVFDPENRPKLKIGLQEFDILNISEKGICFENDKKIETKGWVNGTIVFSDARAIDVDGIIVQQEGGQLGLHLISPIDPKLS